MVNHVTVLLEPSARLGERINVTYPVTGTLLAVQTCRVRNGIKSVHFETWKLFIRKRYVQFREGHIRVAHRTSHKAALSITVATAPNELYPV